MTSEQIEKMTAEYLLRDSFRPQTSDQERKLFEEVYASMLGRFLKLHAGDRFVDGKLTSNFGGGATKFERMQNMFPHGSAGLPLATDIYSVTVRDFPEPFLKHLHDVVSQWREIDEIAGLRSYFPAPSSYHISVAVPQDMAKHAEDPKPHVLAPREELLEGFELEDISAAIIGLVHRRGPFEIEPRGARVGDDGALIFVFDYCAEFVALRKEIIGWTKLLTGGRYTGRPKPMCSITLARALEDPTVTPKCEGLLQKFAARYMPDRAPAQPTEGLAKVKVRHVQFAHETHWMFAQTDFSEKLELGAGGAAIKALKTRIGAVLAGREPKA